MKRDHRRGVSHFFLKSLPKTNNIAPGRRPYQKETHLQPPIFAVSGRVGMTFLGGFWSVFVFKRILRKKNNIEL